MSSPANPNMHARPATSNDRDYIIDLSSRVQHALTSSGSLQEIGPLSRTVVETSIQGSHAYILETNGLRTGSVLVDPLDGTFSNTEEIPYASWGVGNVFPGPFWYLHALMLEPEEQGRGLGKGFIEAVLGSMRVAGRSGTVVLDCWAGNAKLRRFYEGIGFRHHGDFPENDYYISVYVITL
jgi:GNAT superfamily N-acetyltransferase